ncbi:Suppressor of fused protein (SUFU) [Actinoplanes derwentensis]|uniref:Suppressor of fused protein (SUFU) n=2 Tax=Actinoplanes derwentensis TaxID=113562 RepID=A0A1H1WN10_9ACTN|nr:Suppressor of fused protein (SUFU) [Actinoplanes derwentensis]
MWEVVTEALGRLYPREQPWHVSYVAGEHVLEAGSVYPADGHWHYVTYGLGRRWGVELTFRLVRGAETDPPQWPFVTLEHMAGYANSLAEPLEEGQWVDLVGPITGFPFSGGPDTGLTVLILTADPELGDRFLQLVGVTEAEANGESEIADDRLMVTDPGRARPVQE